MEETQPINPNPENSGLTQYIQIVIVVFMVVSQSESEGHSHLLIWSLSCMLSRRLIWLFSHLLIWSFSRLLSRLLIRPFLAF